MGKRGWMHFSIARILQIGFHLFHSGCRSSKETRRQLLLYYFFMVMLSMYHFILSQTLYMYTQIHIPDCMKAADLIRLFIFLFFYFFQHQTDSSHLKLYSTHVQINSCTRAVLQFRKYLNREFWINCPCC